MGRKVKKTTWSPKTAAPVIYFGFLSRGEILMCPKRKATVLALILVCTLLASCNRESSTGDGMASAPTSSEIAGKLRVTGSSTIAPLISEIAKRFHMLYPKVEINVEMGGSARGLSDARDGKADIGMVSRVIADSEQDLKGFPIARDGLGMVVHKDNPVTTLTSDQIVGIFTGRITNWSKVGGRNAPIIVINREDGRGSTDLFTQHFKLQYREIQAQVVIGDNEAVIDAVASRPNAISMMSVIDAENMANAGASIKLASLDGVAATRANILTGNYPLVRPLTLVTRGLPRGLAEQFIEYSLSPQVVDIVEKMGFVPYQE
jgi:phosphate transport system substrate-binding protein